MNNAHGMSGTKIYTIWVSMKQRCYYKKHKNYNDYGGRGIIVCKEWRNNPMAFINWAMQNGYKEGLTLDRIDYNGNYEPINCRFVTWTEQHNNTRANSYITAFGETKTIAQWARDKRCNVSYMTLVKRINYSKFSVEDAIKLPSTKKEKTSMYIGVSYQAKRNKYCSMIYHKGKAIFLGRYIDEKDAALAYNNAAKKYLGEKAILNEI